MWRSLSKGQGQYLVQIQFMWKQQQQKQQKHTQIDKEWIDAFSSFCKLLI